MAKDSKPGGYPPGDVERFDLSRRRIHGEGIMGMVSLQLGSKVHMTLGEYYSIGVEMDRLRKEVDILQNTVTAVRTAVS